MPSQSNQQCSPEALTSWAWLCVLVGLFGSQEVSLHWPLWSHGSYSEAFWSFGSLFLFYARLQTLFVYKVENTFTFSCWCLTKTSTWKCNGIYTNIFQFKWYNSRKVFPPSSVSQFTPHSTLIAVGVFLWYLLVIKWFGWLPAAPQAAKSHIIKMSFHFSLRKRQKATSDRKA